MNKVWTAEELRGEYGLAAEWEARMRNMSDEERAEFLAWSRKAAPTDLKDSNDRFREMSWAQKAKYKENEAFAAICNMQGI